MDFILFLQEPRIFEETSFSHLLSPLWCSPMAQKKAPRLTSSKSSTTSTFTTTSTTATTQLLAAEVRYVVEFDIVGCADLSQESVPPQLCQKSPAFNKIMWSDGPATSPKTPKIKIREK